MHVRDVFLLPNPIGGGGGGISSTNPPPNSMIVDSGWSETETKRGLFFCGGAALKLPPSSTLSHPHGAEN